MNHHELYRIVVELERCPVLDCNGELDTGYECTICGYDAQLLYQTLQRERILLYWLLKTYLASFKPEWQQGSTLNETLDRVLDVLANWETDPALQPETVMRLRDLPEVCHPGTIARWRGLEGKP